MSEPAVMRVLDTGLRCIAASRTRTLPVASPSQLAPVLTHCPLHPPATPAVASNRCVLQAETETLASPAVTTSTGTTTPVRIAEEKTSPDLVRSFKEMPGPKGYPVVGTLLEYFRKENRGMMPEIQRRNHQRYGGIFKEPFGPIENVCVADPSIVEEILRSEGQFPNRPPYQSWVLYNKMRNKRGGLMTKQGQLWKNSRRALNAVLMKQNSVTEFVNDLNKVTSRLVDRIRLLRSEHSHRLAVPGLTFELNKYTMEAMGKVLLDVHIKTLDKEISPKIQQFIEAIAQMFLTGHQLMAFARIRQLFRRPIWCEHEKAWDTIYAIANELMADKIDAAINRLKERPHHSDEHMDVISHLVSTQLLTRDDIIDNLTETFISGVDTLANAISFLLYLLSKNQSAQDKLRTEVDSVLGNRTCTFQDLQNIPYVKAVVKETLRMFPPIPINARVTQEDVVLAGYHVPKGTIIMLNNYTMSRDERIFAEPDTFNPDRWLRAEVASWHPFSVIPFGYGTRSCVGRRLSETVMYLCVIQIIQNFSLKKDPSFDITPEVRTQFTPGPELPIHFVER